MLSMKCIGTVYLHRPGWPVWLRDTSSVVVTAKLSISHATRYSLAEIVTVGHWFGLL
jgi:hypothetical protein